MPAYQYECPKCGHCSEIFKPISESSREEKCSADACDGVLVRDYNGQASGFRLQGSGWTGNKLTKKGR